MHISPLLLLSLSTLALSLPTNTTTLTTASPSPFQKRASYPWIDWFADDDGTCASREGGEDSADENFTEMKAGQCVPFSSATTRVGGSWGADFDAIGSFWAFENGDCTGAVKQTVQRKGKENGFCFTMACEDGYDLANPCYFQSVRGNW